MSQRKPVGSKISKKEHDEFVAAVCRALKRAAKVARKTARMHGIPIALWRDGKVVLEKP